MLVERNLQNVAIGDMKKYCERGVRGTHGRKFRKIRNIRKYLKASTTMRIINIKSTGAL